MKFKYVICQLTGPVLWPYTDHVWHKHIARATSQEEPNPVTSAGFAEIGGGKVRCYGRSESLSIDSKPAEDARAIAAVLGMEPVIEVVPVKAASPEREPYKRGRNGDQDMHLPDGKTCGDCVHFRRCNLMFGHIATDEVCDWAPSRFRLAASGAAA